MHKTLDGPKVDTDMREPGEMASKGGLCFNTPMMWKRLVRIKALVAWLMGACLVSTIGCVAPSTPPTTERPEQTPFGRFDIHARNGQGRWQPPVPGQNDSQPVALPVSAVEERAERSDTDGRDQGI
jgi:hypothetical protein